jgi:hypothetical protein
MAVAYIQEFPIEDRSTTNYDAVASKLEGIDADGLIVHTAGFDDEAGVFRIMDIWESEEQCRRFLDDHVMPIVGEIMGANPDLAPPSRDGFYELHDVIVGAEVKAGT